MMPMAKRRSREIFSGPMRPALHQIRSQFALRQQGISCDIFAPDSDALQQRDEHPDFIGLLGCFAARYGQCADFFWVTHKVVSCPTTLMRVPGQKLFGI